MVLDFLIGDVHAAHSVVGGLLTPPSLE
jgi:hypothetical protein